jgi:hypothetical protein
VALGLMDVRLRLQTQTRQNAGNENPIMKSETAFMSEARKHFCIQAGYLQRGILTPAFMAFTGVSRQCLRNSVKRIQRKQIHCERSRYAYANNCSVKRLQMPDEPLSSKAKDRHVDEST